MGKHGDMPDVARRLMTRAHMAVAQHREGLQWYQELDAGHGAPGDFIEPLTTIAFITADVARKLSALDDEAADTLDDIGEAWGAPVCSWIHAQQRSAAAANALANAMLRPQLTTTHGDCDLYRWALLDHVRVLRDVAAAKRDSVCDGIAPRETAGV